MRARQRSRDVFLGTREYLESAALEPDDYLSSALAAIDRAMTGMPARNRNVLIALRMEEKSRQEVAAYYGLSLRTVDTALRLALDYCAERLGHQMPEKHKAFG